MKWTLFIDDERFPEFVGINYPVVVARNSYDALRFVDAWGMPNQIWFDHDLGEKDTAMTFVRWLEGEVAYKGLKIPDDFTFAVHSMNPIGAENIRSAMAQLIEHYK